MSNRSVDRLPVASITVTDNSLTSKKQFLRVMNSVVTVHNDALSYFTACLVLLGEDCPMAFFSVRKIDEMPKKVVAINPEIHVCRADFIVGGQSFEDLIPYVVHHEKIEAWNMVGRRMLSPRQSENDAYEALSHQNAMLSEYRMASRQGKGKRHLELMRKQAENFFDDDVANLHIENNNIAYRKAEEIRIRSVTLLP